MWSLQKTGDFVKIVLEFVSEEKTLAKIAVPYGGSLKPSDLPGIPQKNGFPPIMADGKFDDSSAVLVDCRGAADF